MNVRTIDTLTTIADTTAGAQAALLARMEPLCRTCDDYTCLDCADGVRHDRCTRACPACGTSDVDWDGAWETSAIITELRGLDRVDRAIRAL